eukprot:402743-Pyramimonas_sp.AAC.1
MLSCFLWLVEGQAARPLISRQFVFEDPGGHWGREKMNRSRFGAPLYGGSRRSSKRLPGSPRETSEKR